MNATLTRVVSTDAGTFGFLVLDDGTTYHSGELPWRDNKHQQSRIPVGTYTCSIYHSPAHGDVYQVQNVPDRSYIEIHSANWFGDKAKGYKADMLGCIGLGKELGTLLGQPALLSSKPAIDEFMHKQGGKAFLLTIKDK